MSIQEFANTAARELPESWYLDVETEKGSAQLCLYDPSGNKADLGGDELTLDQQFEIAIDYARVSEDLPPHFNKQFSAADYLINTAAE